MSDWKRSCPACKSHTSAIGRAFAEGLPCPYCGLPADVAEIVDRAERKGIESEVLDRLARAEARAAAAEREMARLAGLLGKIGRIARTAEGAA